MPPHEPAGRRGCSATSSEPGSSSRAHARRLPALRPARAEPAPLARRAAAPLRGRARRRRVRRAAAPGARAPRRRSTRGSPSAEDASLGRVGAAQARAAARRITRKGPMATTQRHDVKDLALAAEGKRRIEWADRQMPVLAAIRERFEREQPLAGYRVSACLHVTTETANLARTLQGGRRRRRALRLEPALDAGRRRRGARRRVRHRRLRDQGRGQRHLLRAHRGGGRPQAATDDGRRRRRDRRPPLAPAASSSATSSPAPRRRRPASSGSRRSSATGKLGFPVIAVNEAKTKHLFDNRYGTGQSTIDGIIRATNVLLAGQALRRRRLRLGRARRRVAGPRHGRARDRHRGRSDARRSRPRWTASRCCRWRRRPRSATSSAPRPATRPSSRARTWSAMKDGAILANTGHFNVEIDIPALRVARRGDARGARVRRGVHARGRPPAVPARRRPARQPRRRRGASGARDGHVLREPGARGRVRDPERGELERKVYPVPQEIDEEIARLKLATMGVEIDKLTEEQAKYLASGTRGPETSPARSVLEPERIVRLEDDAVVLLDQRRLPDEEVELAAATRRRGRGRDPRRWPSAARPRSGSRPRTGYALAARRGEDLDEAERVLARVAADGGQSRLGARADARRPDRRARTRAPRRGGRALPADGGARRGAASRRARARSRTATPAGSRPAATARRSARSAPRGSAGCSSTSGSTRRGRCCRAPADRVGARAGRHPARRDRRLGGGLADGRGRGRLRRHRRRPDRRERRHREQDRHVRARRARRAPRDPALRRRAELDASTSRRPTGAAIPIEERDGGGDHGALPGAQPRVRRHAGRR